MTPFRSTLIVLIIFVVITRLKSIQAGAIENAIEENGGKTDVSSIYKVVLTWYDSENEKSKSEALEVLHQLADSGKHVMSSVKLGHHYAEDENIAMAIKYFAQAGEEGPHHQSIYNAGRLLAEQGDWVGALAYLKAAANLSQSQSSKYISSETTQSALEAYEIISRQLSREEFTVELAADFFIYGSLTELSTDAQELWIQAVQGILKLSQTIFGTSQSRDALMEVIQFLRILWEQHGITGALSDLQIYILLDIINDMLGLLVDLDDSYIPMAAAYAELLATHSIYCYDHFATTEDDDSACFNAAAATAMSFYHQLADSDSAKRILRYAQEHPAMADHWFVDDSNSLLRSKGRRRNRGYTSQKQDTQEL